jgi:hypothetical protein
MPEEELVRALPVSAHLLLCAHFLDNKNNFDQLKKKEKKIMLM